MQPAATPSRWRQPSDPRAAKALPIPGVAFVMSHHRDRRQQRRPCPGPRTSHALRSVTARPAPPPARRAGPHNAGVDSQRLQLINRYRALRDVPDTQVAKAKRGREFNQFLAEVLTAGGAEARADNRGLDGRDEIDVVFAVDGVRYIAEAKWLNDAVNDDPIGKIERRLKTRPPGVRPAFFSMSGYIDLVLRNAETDPTVVLLDRTHVEILVSGLFTPYQLFDRLHTVTARRGGSYVSVTNLLTPDLPTFMPGWRAAAPDTVLPSAEYAPGVTVRPLWAGVSLEEATGLTGVSEHEVLVTTYGGVHRLNITTGDPVTREDLVLAGRRHGSSAQLRGDSELLVLTEEVVVSRRDGELEALAGAITGAGRLLAHPDGSVWAFSTTGPTGPVYRGSHTLVRVGDRLGDEQRHTIEFSGQVDNVVFTADGRLYLVGGSRSGHLDIEQKMALDSATWRDGPPARCDALLALDAQTILSAGPDPGGAAVVVHRTDVATNRHSLVCRLPGLNRATALVLRGDGRVLLLADNRGNEQGPHPVLLEVELA
ncbi:hypothetical protein ABT095_14505 [Kitasatospora sp. NPDC002227]|uniref:hypothetical protein n=1 Tax=Kitasatospora sp. NPDC002227 TaxID=3154773 RepID=UPI00331F4AB2